MKAAGYNVRESDPFEPRTNVVNLGQTVAPITARLRALWGSSREAVIELFPKAPGLPKNREAYLRFIDEIYKSDAYHSLSIEGYQVTPELIEKVRTGAWNPDGEEGDRDNRNALAARGYWQAFQLVKDSVEKIINGQKPGPVMRAAHGDWYRELFQPSVAAGLIKASALAGYRNHTVFLRGSRYVPPRWEAVRDALPTLFDLIEGEDNPGVRAVLGHWLFGYIHPYPDGNGRMARFLMNAMLASGGYPWTVIRVENRRKYLAALDSASIDLDIRPFARFIAERVQWSLDQAA
ncbi:MAG: Fic family protein [Methyloceanibacter sp.]